MEGDALCGDEGDALKSANFPILSEVLSVSVPSPSVDWMSDSGVSDAARRLSDSVFSGSDVRPVRDMKVVQQVTLSDTVLATEDVERQEPVPFEPRISTCASWAAREADDGVSARLDFRDPV